jgi:hypothetical protein
MTITSRPRPEPAIASHRRLLQTLTFACPAIPCPPLRRYSSAVEQRIRNARVVGSSPTTGFRLRTSFLSAFPF